MDHVKRQIVGVGSEVVPAGREPLEIEANRRRQDMVNLKSFTDISSGAEPLARLAECL
jgi:hypothetical protein